MRTNMPTATSSVNTAHGKTSYVVIVARRGDFPAPAHLGIVSPVSDLNNAGLTFSATIVTKTPKRVAVKLVAINPPGGGVTPLDGILAITLSNINTGVPLPVSEVPVEYIDDPLAPPP